MELNNNKLEKISGGKVIELKNGKFGVGILSATFDNKEKAKKFNEIYKQLLEAKEVLNQYQAYYDPTDWDAYLHHKFNLKCYNDRIKKLEEELEKLKNYRN